MPTAAELSPTQRRWVVQQSGFDPSTHELDNNGFIKPIRVATAPSVSDNDFPHPKVEPSAPEAPGFTETAIHSAINAAPAAAVGSSAAALVAPWSSAVAQIPHPLAKLAYLIPPAVGAIAGGLEHYGQTKLQEAFTPEELAKLQAMQQANPWGARVGGGAAMMVGGFNPNPLNVARAAGSLGKVISKPLTGINLTAPELQNLANVGIGTGVGTGITAAQNLVTGRPIEEGLGEAALTSALFNSPNAIGRRMGFENPVDLNIHPTRADLVNGTPVVAPPAEVVPQMPIDINAYLAAGNEIQPSAPSITPESVMANLFPGQTVASRAVKQTTPRSPIFAADPELQILNAQGQIPEPSTVQPITRYKTVQPPAKSAEASWRDIEMLKRENAPVEQRLRLTDYLRAMREKQAQDDAELLQAASTQQQQLTAQKLQVGAELLNQQKAQHEADIAALQAAMRGNQLGGVEVAPKPLVETPLGKEIYPDYTGVKEAGNAEVANLPPIDIEAEAIQAKLSKYSEGGALRPQTEAEKQTNERLNAAGIQLTPTQEWNAKMQNVAAYRGQKLTTDKPVRNAQGQEMAGMATGREAFVSPTKGQIVTAPHEMQGHNFVNDLRNSKNAADRKLASDYDAFTASNPEFHAINAERTKQGLEPWTPEEFNANNAGAEYVMDRLGLRNESEFKTWWKDIASHYRAKQGGANAADFQRVLNYKFVNDAPFNPANYTGVGAAKDQFSEGQTKSADRIRYEEIQKSIMDHVMRDDTDSPEFTKLWQESENIKNRNGGNPPKYSEGDSLRAAAPDFKLTTQKELEKDKPFGLQISRNGTVESKQLRAKINSLPASEQEMLRMSGVDELMKLPAVNVKELREHLDANAPKVEVHSYGMEGKVSEAKKEYDRMTHEWYDLLPSYRKTQVEGYLTGTRTLESLIEKQWLEKDLDILKKYEQVNKARNAEAKDASPRATPYYSHVSALPADQPMPEWTASKSGKNVQRVDVVIPKSTDASLREAALAGRKQIKMGELWQPDNLHENLPNTLGWAMIQYKTGANGEKIAVIAEAQSRWGQERRALDKYVKRDRSAGWYEDTPNLKTPDHPLLRDYNRLILKAAIDQARKEGATHIVVSDAETAMMTEGHDAHITTFPTEKEATMYAERNGGTVRERQKSSTDPWSDNTHVYDVTTPQEPGMRLNYDTILPRIAEELTGSKGDRVSLGEHKNAFETWGGSLPIDSTKPRSNLIFRNPDGTPKTDVSGRMYPIEGTSLAARREAGEPFSLTAPKYSEGDALRSEAKRPVKQPWITPLVASEIQKIERIGTPRAKSAANAVREFYRINSRNRGQLETSFIRDVINARPWELSAKGLVEWAKMDTPENAKVVAYLNDMSDAGKSEIKLSPVEQKIADAVRTNLLKSKAMMESFKSAGDIEGLAHGTAADPNYFPNLMSRKASRVIAETPDSPEAMQMHKDFIEYNMKKGGMTEAEAEDKWALLKGGYAQQKAQLAQQFGPIDKLAGVGLPRSMRETNLFDIMSRFNRRYARRLAYHEAIERNQAASDALFNPKNGLEANQATKNVLEDIYGVREHNEDIRRAATGIIRAGMIGTLAGVKDFTTNMVLGMQHMDMDQPIPSLIHAFETAKENYRKAQDTGVVRYNFAGVEQGEGGFTDVIHWLDRARDIANTVQGRALLENGARTIAMGQGQFLAREALHALANKKLTAQKRKFLDDFVPNWENYKTTAAPAAVITEAAARFVESVQGTYDYRGLPSIAMKGTLAPYLSLARWNIEKFNNFMQHTIEPARNGNWTPLLMSTVGMLIGGAAVEQIVELAQHKKSKLPELSEIEAAKEEEQWKLAGYKLAGYASMSGYAGVLADVAKIGIDTAYKNRVNTYNNPLIEGLTTATEDVGQLAEAIAKNDVASVTSIIGTFLEDFSQTYRVANAQLNPEKQKANERSDKYRDLKLFNMGQGNDLADSGDTRPNPFLSPETKQFKQTGDVEEAKKLGKELIAKAVKKANGDPEVLMAELSKLKHNSYQTMPSPDTLPAKFIKYYNWLVKTQGQAKADEVKADYIRQNALNRAKSGMIP